MSDTYRRYRAIKQGLMHFYQLQPTGHQDRHLNTLIALICGLCGGQRAHLSTIADHAPAHNADQESVITRFRRWLKHDTTTLNGWFLPVAEALLCQERRGMSLDQRFRMGSFGILVIRVSLALGAH